MRHRTAKRIGLFSFYSGVCLVVVFLGLTDALRRVDWRIFDMNFRIRGKVEPDGRIYIVGVDAESERYFQESAAYWNIREVLTGAMKNLSTAGVSVIAVDYLLPKRRGGPEVEKIDRRLADVIESIDSYVVLATAVKSGGFVHADKRFLDGAYWEGVINVQEDEDGVLRRFRLNIYAEVRVDEKEYFYSFPVAVASTYLEAEEKEDEDGNLLLVSEDGEYVIPKDGLLINYVGPPGSFPHIPIWCAYEGALDGYELDGAIVLIADTRLISGDVFEVPTSFYGGVARGLMTMTGIEVHANALHTILTQTHLQEASPLLRSLILFGVFGSALFLFYIQTSRYFWTLILAPALIFLGLLSLQYLLFAKALLVLPVSLPLLGVLLHTGSALAYRVLFLARREKQIRTLFGRYVSENVVRKMVDEEVVFDLEGHTKELSILFADIRGFTSLSEKLTAKETGFLLNRFFDEMTAAVFALDGTLDKLMGDCIMAFFNDPDEQPDHAERAASVALDMLARLQKLRESGLKGADALDIGVGLNTGVATVGNLGAPQFYDYTAVGDTVNTASRLQGLTREYGVRIIVGDATYQAVKERFICRRLDTVRVKGKEEPVVVYELMGRRVDVDEKLLSLVERYKEALRLYHSREFDSALESFERILEEFPDDGPSRVFVERCRLYVDNPPPKDWDGVFALTRK